jgi:hypothetical protein
MNIKKIGSVIVLASALLTPALSASAMDLSKVQVKLSGSINQDCLGVGDHDPVLGCFIQTFEFWAGHPDLRPVPTIYIQKDLPAPLIPYVFLYNLGQYVVLSYSDQELMQVFDPIPSKDMTAAIRRAAGNAFVVWAMGGKITPAKADFFKAALAR